MRKVSYLSYNMTTADANNPDGIVPVGRQFDFRCKDLPGCVCRRYDGVQSYFNTYRKYIKRLQD